MADLVSYLALLAGACGIGYAYIINKRLRNATKFFLKKFSEMNIESKLADIGTSGDQQEAHEDIHTLANNLFFRLKEMYQLNSKSYSEIIEEIKLHSSIEPDAKELLVNFFDEMILVTYKQEELSMKQKEEIRNAVKLILKRIPAKELLKPQAAA